tara:strand:+ start:242 stop:661 length:420 start_codon:yes stop_codon:yes gene_type:complete
MKKASNKKLKEDVHKFIEDEDYANAVSVLRSGMEASHTIRQSRDDGQRGVNYVEVPDHSTRLTSARLMLEYGFGKPATRHDINVTDNTQIQASPAEVMARLANSGQDLVHIMNTYTESAKKVQILEDVEVLELTSEENS